MAPAPLRRSGPHDIRIGDIGPHDIELHWTHPRTGRLPARSLVPAALAVTLAGLAAAPYNPLLAAISVAVLLGADSTLAWKPLSALARERQRARELAHISHPDTKAALADMVTILQALILHQHEAQTDPSRALGMEIGAISRRAREGVARVPGYEWSVTMTLGIGPDIPEPALERLDALVPRILGRPSPWLTPATPRMRISAYLRPGEISAHRRLALLHTLMAPPAPDAPGP